MDKKTLKAVFTFTEDQNIVSNFIAIYIVTWLAWHNQLFSGVLEAQGDFFTRLSTSIAEMGENQYLLVFFLSFIITLARLAFDYISFQSRESVSSGDEIYANYKEDQKFDKNSDIGILMDTLTKTKDKLVSANEREKQAIADKNATIKKMLLLQHELEEAKADIDMLTKAQASKTES